MKGLDAVLIAGPTTSGKSALAVRLARRLGGPVVNADSMQVYRDLAILTARPVPAEMEEVPHLLYGHVDGAETFSVARWAEEARAVLAACRARGEVPVVVGGTGLYFRALTRGLSAIPAVPGEVRARVRAEAHGRPSPELHADLARLDPEGARRLRPGDRQRVLRALEVRLATGRPLRAFQDEVVPGPLAGRRWTGLFLQVGREVLRARIDARFRAMMEGGALDEVAALAARGLDPALPVMRAHGVPGLIAYLRGEATRDEAIRRGQADTRAYAKRQETWFRGQMEEWTAVESAEAALERVSEAGSQASRRVR